MTNTAAARDFMAALEKSIGAAVTVEDAPEKVRGLVRELGFECSADFTVSINIRGASHYLTILDHEIQQARVLSFPWGDCSDCLDTDCAAQTGGAVQVCSQQAPMLSVDKYGRAMRRAGMHN